MRPAVAVAFLVAVACNPYEIRRVATVPPLEGTPTSAHPQGIGGVRVAANAMPIRSFFETNSTMREGDPGEVVHTSMFGGSIRVGLSDYFNMGFRYETGAGTLTQRTHDPVAPPSRKASSGYGVEFETAIPAGRIGFVGGYFATGIQSIPHREYRDMDGDHIFETVTEDTSQELWWHFALLGGIDIEWMRAFGGVNIQTGYTNVGIAQTTVAGEVIEAAISGNVATIETVVMFPTFFIGVEFAPVPYLRIGLEAWTHTADNETAYAGPGIGAWLAFESGSLY